MVEYEWDVAQCRRYADNLRGLVKRDHRPWAARIAAHLSDLPEGATVMDVVTGFADVEYHKAGFNYLMTASKV